MPISINGTGTLTGISVGGVNDGCIAHADLADSTKPIFTSYAILEDQKSSGTHGGGNTSGSWQTRELNTEIVDPDGIVSVSSNEFQLAAGNYLIKWWSPFFKVGTTKTRLLDVTNSASRGASQSIEAGTSVSAVLISRGAARVTPTGTTTYKIQYYNSDTKSSNGLGVAAASGEVEVYTQVVIYKEAS